MDDVQATAKWANRMLRPLTSIYRRLEKHNETLAIIAEESRTRDQQDASQEEDPEPVESTSAREHYSGSEADEEDPVWIPGKRPDRRRVRHRYSARTERMTGKKRARLAIHSPEAPRTLPGAIELATPVITGRRWEMPSSAQSQPSVEQRKAPPPQEHQAFRDRYSLHKSHWQQLLDSTGDPGLASIARNLDQVFQNFLFNTRVAPRETSPGDAKPRMGARSLLSMVVRSLPDYIAMEQDAQDELDPDADEDMCDAYFTELESFYAPHGNGWRPLREAVRVQGIHLVSMMIQNKWLPHTIVHQLLERCRNKEGDACQLLLSTVLSEQTRRYPYPLGLRVSPGDPISFLHRFASQGQLRRAYRSYLFDELSKLIRRGVLPPEWMVTKPWKTWMTRATISFSSEDSDCFSASELLQAVLVSASGINSIVAIQAPQRKRPIKHDHDARSTRNSSTLSGPSTSTERNCSVQVEDALNNQVVSLLAAICGMHISRSRVSETDNDAHSTKAGHLIEHIFFAVRKEMDDTPLSDVSTLPPSLLLRRGCILLADCLLQCNDAILARNTQPVLISSAGIEEYSRILTSRGDLIKDLAIFVRHACRCCGSTSNEEDTFMASEVRRMVSRLPHLAEHSQLATFLSRVAVETAMEFAEGTGDPDDHVWAIEIQETAMDLRKQTESTSDTESEPEVAAQKQGLYRWEDSIGEWVARTPAAKPSNTITIGRKRRASELSLKSPCVPCSTGSSSPESDRFEESASSLLSSPSSIGAQDDQGIETSPTRPAKRPRRTAPMVVVEQTRSPPQSPVPPSTRSRSPSLEPVPSHRRVLRDLSNRLANRPPAPVEPQPTAKVEVVIINNKSSRPEPARSPIERAEKRVNRSMNRQRSGRPLSISRQPAPVIFARRQSVVPCSQDDDSEDELSFM